MGYESSLSVFISGTFDDLDECLMDFFKDDPLEKRPEEHNTTRWEVEYHNESRDILVSARRLSGADGCLVDNVLEVNFWPDWTQNYILPDELRPKGYMLRAEILETELYRQCVTDLLKEFMRRGMLNSLPDWLATQPTTGMADTLGEVILVPLERWDTYRHLKALCSQDTMFGVRGAKTDDDLEALTISDGQKRGARIHDAVIGTVRLLPTGGKTTAMFVPEDALWHTEIPVDGMVLFQRFVQRAKTYFDNLISAGAAETSLPTIPRSRPAVMERIVYAKMPYQFYRKIKELSPPLMENKEPFFFVADEAGIGENTDPVTVYFREPRELVRGKFHWTMNLFAIPNPLGCVKAECWRDGKSILCVSAYEEYWPELSKTWEWLKETIKLWLEPVTSGSIAEGETESKQSEQREATLVQPGNVNIQARTVYMGDVTSSKASHITVPGDNSTTIGREAKSRRWAIVSFIALTLIGLLTNIAAPILPEPLKANVWLAWPLLAAFSVIYVVLLLMGKV